MHMPGLTSLQPHPHHHHTHNHHHYFYAATGNCTTSTYYRLLVLQLSCNRRSSRSDCIRPGGLKEEFNLSPPPATAVRAAKAASTAAFIMKNNILLDSLNSLSRVDRHFGQSGPTVSGAGHVERCGFAWGAAGVSWGKIQAMLNRYGCMRARGSWGGDVPHGKNV